MHLKRTIAALVLAGSLAGAPGAWAGNTKTYAPPGKSGTSEYSEVVPASGGNVLPPSMGGGNPTAAEISELGHGKAGVKKLSRLGKQGVDAAQFAQATAPARATRTGVVPGSASGPAAGGNAFAPGGNAFSGFLHLIDGSDVDGIGALLPLLLLLGLAGAGGLGVLRSRRPRRRDASHS